MQVKLTSKNHVHTPSIGLSALRYLKVQQTEKKKLICLGYDGPSRLTGLSSSKRIEKKTAFCAHIENKTVRPVTLTFKQPLFITKRMGLNQKLNARSAYAIMLALLSRFNRKLKKKRKRSRSFCTAAWVLS